MIWVIGKDGMLGSELARQLDLVSAEWTGTDREVSITSLAQLRETSTRRHPMWIVNCAAYTAVDRAEEEVGAAYSLNSDGPGNIGRIASEAGAQFIQISTDYVFDGTATAPYREDTPVRPLGVYGASKAKGEVAALKQCADTYIIRTAWLYGRTGSNFVRTLLRLMTERDLVRVVNDQHGTPTNAGDLARVIIEITGKDLRRPGIYHYSNEGQTTWYEFALAIREEAMEAGILRKTCEIVPISTAEYPTKTRRPQYSVLSKSKIADAFGLRIPQWRESLHTYFRDQS
jgi:dTDP-4-dehydrorhamnose reductase